MPDEYVEKTRGAGRGRRHDDVWFPSACARALPSGAILLRFGPRGRDTILVDGDMDDVGVAADGTVLNVALAGTRGDVDRNLDVFATRITDVVGFGLHALRG